MSGQFPVVSGGFGSGRHKNKTLAPKCQLEKEIIRCACHVQVCLKIFNKANTTKMLRAVNLQ